MSLTDAAADPSSRLRAFLDDRFPAIQELACATGTQVASCAIPGTREHGRTIPWRTIGTAIDHRLRLAFTSDAAPKLPGEPPLNPGSTNAITAGVHYALIMSKDPDNDPLYRRIAGLGLELISRFRALAEEEAALFDPDSPVSLGGRIERELCALCYAGAWYDALHRTGDIGDDRNRELRYAAMTSDDLDDMFTAIPETAITNMTDLVRHAGNSDIAILRERTAGTHLCIAGPCFSGSRDVEGADADLIAGGLLLEIKTHANPATTACDTLRQLLGYLLLDYHDTYKLAQAGIYYTRHARLILWSIPDLLQQAGCSHGIAKLRRDCSMTLRG